MLLLHEDAAASSKLNPWLDQLPRQFCTPCLTPKLLDALDSLGCFAPLCKAARKQRKDWDAARARAPGAPTADQFDWAMSVVRSRSFSGPYTPSTFVGSLTTLFGAATLALGYALVVGGAGASDTALNGLGGAAVFVLCNDFVFGPRLTRAKRWVPMPHTPHTVHRCPECLTELCIARVLQVGALPLDRFPQPRRGVGGFGGGLRVLHRLLFGASRLR